jgi:hypothetical protein
MQRTVLRCSLGLILNNFYKKSWSRYGTLKSLIHADDDDDDDNVNNKLLHNASIVYYDAPWMQK